MKWLLTMGLFAMVLVSSAAFAQQGGRGKGGKGHPPPEALAACEGRSAGDACSFERDDEEVEGTCFTPADDKPLACRPSEAP